MCVRVGREGGTHALWLTVPRSLVVGRGCWNRHWMNHHMLPTHKNGTITWLGTDGAFWEEVLLPARFTTEGGVVSRMSRGGAGGD